jgi:hypothetical protein
VITSRSRSCCALSGRWILVGPYDPRAARRGSAATLCPGLICHCPFGAFGRSHRVGRAPKGPCCPEELPCPERTGLTPKKTPSIKKPPCPEGAKQVSPGQSEAAQPPSAALGKRPTPHVGRPEGAKQTRCSVSIPQFAASVRAYRFRPVLLLIPTDWFYSRFLFGDGFSVAPYL